MVGQSRATGKVVWFDCQKKGFGFIKPDDGTEDIFFHRDSIRPNVYRSFKKGQAVEYTVVSEDSQKKPKLSKSPSHLKISKPSKSASLFKNSKLFSKPVFKKTKQTNSPSVLKNSKQSNSPPVLVKKAVDIIAIGGIGRRIEQPKKE